ncbi:MAG: hypothetical protein IKV12_00010 [Alistipes sp.]|nr:hypothetical protein [Alistipes sp.]
MEKRKTWKLNIVLNYLVLVMALVVLGISIYDYSLTQQIDWLYVGLGVVMIFNSIFGVLNAKRKLKEEK